MSYSAGGRHHSCGRCLRQRQHVSAPGSSAASAGPPGWDYGPLQGFPCRWPGHMMFGSLTVRAKPGRNMRHCDGRLTAGQDPEVVSLTLSQQHSAERDSRPDGTHPEPEELGQRGMPVPDQSGSSPGSGTGTFERDGNQPRLWTFHQRTWRTYAIVTCEVQRSLLALSV